MENVYNFKKKVILKNSEKIKHRKHPNSKLKSKKKKSYKN